MKFRFWSYLPSLLVLGLAFGLRLYRLDSQSIWWDEGHSIFVAGHLISQIPTLPAMDVHPPAYFTLLHLWMAIAGGSEFALRYLSVLFSLLTIVLLWRFAGSISNTQPFRPHRLSSATPASSFSWARRGTPLLVSLLAALSPLYVAYAQEVRSYTMITFLALASTFLLWRLLFPGPKREGVQKRGMLLLLYIVSTAACLYTHYFTIFLLLFQNLAWLVWVLFPFQNGSHYKQSLLPEKKFGSQPGELVGTQRFHQFLQVPLSSYFRRGRLFRLTLWAVSQPGILLLFALQLSLALRQVTGYANPNLTPPGLTHFISRSWQAYTVGLTIDSDLARWGMWGMAGVLAIGWLIKFIAPAGPWFTLSKRKLWPRAGADPTKSITHFVFLASWLLIPLAAYFVVLQRRPSFEPRYMMLITPALFLLLALGLNGPPFHPPYSVTPQNLRHPREYWSADCNPHSNFVILPRYVLRFTFYVLRFLPLIIFIISLHSYYTNETYFKDDSASVADWLAAETTANDIVYIDVPHPFHYYVDQRGVSAPTRYLFVDIHTAADTLTNEAAGRDRLFWVTWWGSDTDPRGVIPFLAEKAGQRSGQRDFRGYRVECFDLPGQANFSLPTPLTPANATFGHVLRLDGVAFGGRQDTTTTTVAEPAWATLHFSLLRETEVDYRASLRLRGQDGRIVSQVDKDLLNDRHFHTSAWPLTDPALNQAINVYTLPLAPDTPPGHYRLELLVYNAQPPYPGEGVTGHKSTDGVAAVLGNITIIP
jgi:hypothetical protein